MSMGVLEGIEFQEMPTRASTGGGGTPPAGRQRGGKMRRFLTVLAAVIVLGSAGLVAARWGQYRHGHIVSKNASVRTDVTQLGARLDGVVVSVEVDASECVRAGQVLVRLDDRHLLARVVHAKAEVLRAEHRLAVEKLAIAQARRMIDANVLLAESTQAVREAELDAASSAKVRAEKEFNRLKNLDDRGLAAEDEMYLAVAELSSGKAGVAAAEAARDVANRAVQITKIEKDGLLVRDANLSVFESQVEIARSVQQMAEADVEAMVIRAPGDGWVVRRLVDVGSSVRVGQQILTLRLEGRPWIEAWLDESELSELQVGNRASVVLNSISDRPLSGYVESISVLTELGLREDGGPRTQRELLSDDIMFSVRIALDAPTPELIPGLSATVGIVRGRSSGTAALASMKAPAYGHEDGADANAD